MRLDLTTPLRAHGEWTARLREYVYSERPLDPVAVQRDDLCGLGRWLVEQHPAVHRLPEFETARLAHAALHLEAARVVRLLAAGHRREARLALDDGGRLRQLSAIMVRAFLRLSRRIDYGQPPAAADVGSVYAARTPPKQ